MEQEKNHYADEQLQAMLHRLRKEDPNISCPSGKKVTKICINSECKTALRCSDNRCASCGKDIHKGCLSTIHMQQLTELVNEKMEGCRQLMVSIFKIEEEFIEAIRKNQINFMEKLTSGRNAGQSNILRKIYVDKDYKGLSGKQAFEMTRQLEGKSQINVDESYKLLDKYRKELNQHSTFLNQLKEKYFCHKVHEDKQIYEIQSQILKKKGNIKNDLLFIRKCFDKPIQFQLLFRASQHGFKASAFHRHCDNIQDTFTLIRTQFGKTIAGYTKYTWNRVSSGNYVNDASKKVFLLQIDFHQKMIPISQYPLIICNPSFGPVFGSHDICIYDISQSELSFYEFPAAFNHEGPKKYQRNQESYQIFCGATQGNKGKVEEYQVFRVIWK